ncbi:RICIN domain-containing protein [Amycolatopsis sp. NPDC051071]|uniref:RICIN domain-containing protein n=1 Tax=Amycolatopsis sp. NPDC051071 TaxID=3154637 RepID=UPI00343D3218
MPTGDGTYFYLVARHSGKCLTVDLSDEGTGQRTNQFHCVGADTQMWRRAYQTQDNYLLVVRATGKVLSLDTRGGLGNGQPILTWPHEYGSNQLWSFSHV